MKPFIIFLALFIAIVAGYLFFTDTAQEMADDITDAEVDTVAPESDEPTTTDDQLETSGDTAPPEQSADTTEHVFDIDSFMYGYSMDEIRVNQGDTVTINLTSSEGLHDWVVDEFNAATAIISGSESSSVTFVADQAGTFEFYCSVGNHRAQGMVGTLVVE